MLTVNDKNFDWANIPLGDCLHGNAMDTHFTLRLFHALEELLTRRRVLACDGEATVSCATCVL